MARLLADTLAPTLLAAIIVASATGVSYGQPRPAAPGPDAAAQPGREPVDPPPTLPTQPGVEPGQEPLDLPGAAQPIEPLTPGSDSRIPAQQALQQQTGPQPQGQFTLRLASAPKMLGDFFGRTGSMVTVGELQGEAVHQTIASGSAFANDNLSLITTDIGTGRTIFVGGPAGLTPGSFFLPSIPPPLDDVVPGLTANAVANSPLFTAVLTPSTTDVFDNPADASPSIPNAPIYNIFEVDTLFLPVANPGDLVGRVRIQENNSAMPQDRVYFDYKFFHNVRLTDNGIGVNRFAPGIEKTFWGGTGSVEVRVPMAITLNNEISVDAAPDTSHSEFGNLAISPKLLLWSTPDDALAIGMGIALPTAGDINVVSDSGRLLRVRNDSVHLIPYLGYLYAPRNSPYFMHAFLTVDVDVNGNPVDANVTGEGLEHIGVINDQTLLSASGGLGKYVYRSCCRSNLVQAVAWTTELHYTAAVNDPDVISVGAFQLGSLNDDLSLLNGTVGGHVQLQRSTLTLGYTVPLTPNDRTFDGEFRLFFNRPF